MRGAESRVRCKGRFPIPAPPPLPQQRPLLQAFLSRTCRVFSLLKKYGEDAEEYCVPKRSAVIHLNDGGAFAMFFFRRSAPYAAQALPRHGKQRVKVILLCYLSARWAWVIFPPRILRRPLEGGNIVGQGAFLAGALLLHKSGCAALRLHGGEAA